MSQELVSYELVELAERGVGNKVFGSLRPVFETRDCDLPLRQNGGEIHECCHFLAGYLHTAKQGLAT